MSAMSANQTTNHMHTTASSTVTTECIVTIPALPPPEDTVRLVLIGVFVLQYSVALYALVYALVMHRRLILLIAKIKRGVERTSAHKVREADQRENGEVNPSGNMSNDIYSQLRRDDEPRMRTGKPTGSGQNEVYSNLDFSGQSKGEGQAASDGKALDSVLNSKKENGLKQTLSTAGKSKEERKKKINSYTEADILAQKTKAKAPASNYTLVAIDFSAGKRNKAEKGMEATSETELLDDDDLPPPELPDRLYGETASDV